MTNRKFCLQRCFRPMMILVAGGLILALAAPNMAQDAAKSETPDALTPASVDEAAVQRAIDAGEIEYAIRLLRGDQLSMQRNERVLDLYRQALDHRLHNGDQGAVVQLILNAPPGADADRAQAARTLARLWRADLGPTRRRLQRRLRWYTQIQQAVQPGPLDANLPITLTLLTLDHVDRLLEPEETLALLMIGEQLSPNNLIWKSYQPDNAEMLKVAESLAIKQRLLASMEVYRQLMHRAPQQRDWFRRRLARMQVIRMLDRSTFAGAEAGLFAGSTLRREFLSAEEKARVRALETSLRKSVADFDQRRSLPLNITGELNLEPIPVSYHIQDETYIGPGAVLRLAPGTILTGGRLILEGGEIHFEGTKDKPVTLLGVHFRSDDVKGGGRVFGDFVRFRECRWDRGTSEALPGGTQWYISRSFSANCSWMFDAAAWVNWSGSEFRKSRFQLATTSSRTDSAPVNSLSWSASNQRRIHGCVFFDCEIDDVLAVTAADCSFIDADLIALATREHQMDSTTLVRASYFEPRGEIPYLINQILQFSPGGGPYVFMPAPSGPVIDIGQTDMWVD